MMNPNRRRLFLAAMIAGLSSMVQASGQPYTPKQSDRPETATGDEPGSTTMFDGKTLTGWEGDPKDWRVEDGARVGESTPRTLSKRNTFIIWRGRAPKDFRLKVD